MAITPSYAASVTNQQQQWFDEALRRCTFPHDNLNIQLNVSTVPEPSAQGHSDYMCTTSTGYLVADVEIRERADDPTSPFNFGTPIQYSIQTFYMECVVHELGHVVWDSIATSNEIKTEVASWFMRDELNNRRRGELTDWSGAWSDSIKEAVAETFKDIYMPFRFYDQRTNWRLLRAHFDDYLTKIETVIC